MLVRFPGVLWQIHQKFAGPLNPLAEEPTEAYPIVATTFRLTEHFLSGPMSRFNSWLNELQPEMFAELSHQLAAERQIKHGDWLVIETPLNENFTYYQHLRTLIVLTSKPGPGTEKVKF